MSASPQTRRERPLSPHLSIYKPIPTMMASITHRITGVALYFGTILIAWWLIAAATNEAYFDFVNGIFGSFLGRLVLFGYTLVLMQHMIGGIRHLIWDTGAMLDKATTTKMAWFSYGGAVVLTLLIWIAGYMAR
jgi:succinate dehydrogenase / fumarate reductase cytochrome b subunit